LTIRLGHLELHERAKDFFTAHWRWLDGRRRDRAGCAFIAELEWLRGELDRAVPGARAFVRPGFDEPEDVKMLDASER
jgi:hypothetical protein